MISPEIALPVVDYGAGRGAGLLLASGCGLMLGLMDSLPCLRWCYDLDTDRRRRQYDVEAWLVLHRRRWSQVVVAGWYTLDDPRLSRAVLATASEFLGPERVFGYGGDVALGYATLSALIAAVSAGARRARVLVGDGEEPEPPADGSLLDLAR